MVTRGSPKPLLRVRVLLPLPNKRLPLGNVIQIRMTERELELRNVPVSFFIKKIYKKFQERG